MNKARILIVEDDVDVLNINIEYLKSQGYEVYAAASMKESRFILEDILPDLVILDVMLSDGQSWALCAEIRKKMTIPIIFLTCMNHNSNIVKGIQMGGDAYLTKPYDLNVLNAHITSQLSRYQNHTTGIIEIPPLMIDYLSGSVTLKGRQISLTQKEIQLLSCLALSLGKRIPRAELYQRVWGIPDNTGAYQSIAVHISNLRKKLGIGENSCFDLRNTKDGSYVFSKITY